MFSQITSSPYSTFGVGTIENKGFGIVQSMGGIGIALKSKNYLNNKNPASYTGIDSLSFIFEVGMFLKNTNYSTYNLTQSKLDANLRYLAIGFRMKSFWALSIGIAPYSSVGYTINSSDNSNEGLGTVSTTYSGSGGVNQIYLANSFNITEGLSIGINTSYLFGTIVNDENGYIDNLAIEYNMKSTQRVTGLLADLGVQYSIKQSNYEYCFGATYGFKKQLNSTSDNTYLVYGDSTETELSSTESNFYIPDNFGVGLAVTKNNRLTVGFDYEHANWANIKFSNEELDTRNSNKFSLGAEYSPSNLKIVTGLKRCSYRIGMNYNSSYMRIDNTPINSESVSMGIGIPTRKSRTKINISVEYGINGTKSNNLIEEKYWLGHLNITLHDRWFDRDRYKYH